MAMELSKYSKRAIRELFKNYFNRKMESFLFTARFHLEYFSDYFAAVQTITFSILRLQCMIALTQVIEGIHFEYRVCSVDRTVFYAVVSENSMLQQND